jgi:hypothetical protein
MEWRRGFFRLWLLLSAVWVAALACASTGCFAGNDDALFNTLNAGIEWRGPKGGRSPPPCQRIEVLPTTLQASESDGGSNVITFQRVIVMPDGQKWVEGVTPKQLPAPATSTVVARSEVVPLDDKS